MAYQNTNLAHDSYSDTGIFGSPLTLQVTESHANKLLALSDAGRWQTKQRLGRVQNAMREDRCYHPWRAYVALKKEVEHMQTWEEIG